MCNLLSTAGISTTITKPNGKGAIKFINVRDYKLLVSGCFPNVGIGFDLFRIKVYKMTTCCLKYVS